MNLSVLFQKTIKTSSNNNVFCYTTSMNYWLMKSEPDEFSIDDLKRRPKATEAWTGVRNYQARNYMRDQMKNGDIVLFYHSSCKEIGIAGIAKVVKESFPDPTQFDPNSKYFDPKATQENPRWFLVSVKWLETLSRVITLNELKMNPKLKNMYLVKKGSRLSIQPVLASEYKIILSLL